MAENNRRLDRQDFVLATTATAHGRLFEPVQIQKLLFLVDERLSDELGGKYFSFKPYDYGPFDKDVYDELDILAGQGLVEIIGGSFSNRRHYKLTEAGQLRGDQLIESMSDAAVDGITTFSDYVLSLSFDELVSAIYTEFPEMKANSVFSE